MYWKIFKKKSDIKKGDLVLVRSKGKNSIAFVGKESLYSIPEGWVQDLDFIKEDGTLINLNQNKIGTILKYHNLKVPKLK